MLSVVRAAVKPSAGAVNLSDNVRPVSLSVCVSLTHAFSLSLTGRWPVAVRIYFAFIAIFTSSFGRFYK